MVVRLDTGYYYNSLLTVEACFISKYVVNFRAFPCYFCLDDLSGYEGWVQKSPTVLLECILVSSSVLLFVCVKKRKIYLE